MFLIIGNGRVARHFGTYFDLLELPYLQWARGTHSTDALMGKINQSSHVLLLISDNAIEPFIQTHPTLDGKTVVHFSGCLQTSLCYAAHPLMTFTQALYSLEAYRELPFVIEHGGPAFNELLPGLPNKSFAIKSEQKPLYHALCVMSGNFTVILWQHCLQQLQAQLQLPQAVMRSYMQKIFENLLKSPDSALTGPLARNDQKTIAANLNALAGDPFQQVYNAVVKAFYADNNLKEYL